MANRNIAIRTSFKALDRLEQLLDICEAEFGEQIQSAEDITAIPNGHKAVLLIKFTSGLRVKLNVSALDNYQINSRIRLMQAIGSANFPRVLLQGDGWAAFEWIEGKTVSQHGYSEDVARRAAQLLALIHRAEVEPVTDIGVSCLEEARLKLQKRLPVLIANDLLSEVEAQTVTELCTSVSPDTVKLSLIHGDFSPANLVVHEDKLYSVDNEKIQFYVTDYDVCRAVNFWDEWNSSGRHLLVTYTAQSGASFAPHSLLFWGAFDLVYRISYRLSYFGELNKFCIRRLRQILRTRTFYDLTGSLQCGPRNWSA